MASFLQWGMTIATANPDIIVSPTVAIILGTIIFFCGIAEVIIDLLYLENHTLDVQRKGFYLPTDANLNVGVVIGGLVGHVTES